MRVAVPACRGRISPVLDVAERLRLFDVRGGEVAGQAEHVFRVDRIREIKELGVGVVICAGVSREVAASLRAQQIEVVSGVCGLVEDVVEAYLEGRLSRGNVTEPAGIRVESGRDDGIEKAKRRRSPSADLRRG